MASACQTLKQQRAADSKTRICTIACSVGFNDLSCFNRIFRATSNCAPGQYIANCANPQWKCLTLK